MAIYKRYKGRRLKPGEPNWDKGKWWMEFCLRGHDIHESIPGARAQAQALRAESNVRESIYDGKYNRLTKTKRFSDFVDEVYLPWAKSEKASWENDESRAKALKDFFGNKALRDITPHMVRRLKGELASGVTRSGSPR